MNGLNKLIKGIKKMVGKDPNLKYDDFSIFKALYVKNKNKNGWD